MAGIDHRAGRRALGPLALGALLAPAVARGSKPPRLHAPGGVALRGHDPVAYMLDGMPAAGDERFAAEWAGARWLFRSAEHRATFLAMPDRYAPQYGGHCAWAMARGYLAPADPLQWHVVGGRLFVNFDAAVHRRWLRDIPGFIAAADRNWPRFG